MRRLLPGNPFLRQNDRVVIQIDGAFFPVIRFIYVLAVIFNYRLKKNLQDRFAFRICQPLLKSDTRNKSVQNQSLIINQLCIKIRLEQFSLQSNSWLQFSSNIYGYRLAAVWNVLPVPTFSFLIKQGILICILIIHHL